MKRFSILSQALASLAFVFVASVTSCVASKSSRPASAHTTASAIEGAISVAAALEAPGPLVVGWVVSQWNEPCPPCPENASCDPCEPRFIEIADSPDPARQSGIAVMRLDGYCDQAPELGTRHVFEILPSLEIMHCFSASSSQSSKDEGRKAGDAQVGSCEIGDPARRTN